MRENGVWGWLSKYRQESCHMANLIKFTKKERKENPLANINLQWQNSAYKTVAFIYFTTKGGAVSLAKVVPLPEPVQRDCQVHNKIVTGYSCIPGRCHGRCLHFDSILFLLSLANMSCSDEVVYFKAVKCKNRKCRCFHASLQRTSNLDTT